MRSHLSFDWTDERIDELKRLHAGGQTFEAIATVMGNGLSRNAVIGKARRLGLLRGRKPGRGGSKVRRVNPGSNIARAMRIAARQALAKARSPVAPPAPPTAPTCKPIALLDLLPHHCRWIETDAAGAETLFCGAPQKDGPEGRTSYCAYHHQLTHARSEQAHRRAAA